MQKLDRLNDAIKYLRTIGIISTQQDIADNMRMHKSTISSALSGNEKYLTDSFLSKFNFAFNCIFDEEWLINGIGSMLYNADFQEKTASNSTLLGSNDSISINKELINKRFISVVNHLLVNDVVSGKGDLAKVLFISNSKFSEILNGRMNVGVDLIAMICEKYEINSNWLLTGRGSMVDCDNNKDSDKSSHSDSIPADNQFSDISVFYERTIERKEQKIEELTLLVGRLQHEVEMLQQDKKTALRKDDVLGAAKKTGTNDQ